MMALEAEQLSTMSDAEIRDSTVIENDEIEIQSQLHNGVEAVQESPVEQQQLFVQERDLLDGKVVGESKRIEQGINGKASVVELEGGVRGVFKTYETVDEPARQTVIARERAAFLVDNFLGFGRVPPTVIREVGGKKGSFQQFIPDARTFHKVSAAEREGMQSDLEAIRVLDAVITNKDDNEGNFLAREGRAYAIDRGTSMYEIDQKSLPYALGKKSISPETARKIMSVRENIQEFETQLHALEAQLQGAGLPAETAVTLSARLKAIVGAYDETGRFDMHRYVESFDPDNKLKLKDDILS